ncbi:DUF1345 domain-containing protein [Salinibacterium hongtaonis]|uniref:DUF1345 domain-containing protein n=1 Tax=Homoserinimonas hongtaonis TaxID=2079791 RepID=UPI000D37E4EC|nr:DUF1345 domain-containing protein [Salinibacterium hongtaonis]AWB89357.1 hypothetical protein C2138_07230 [Salinibacterium hongtaonis]
MSPQHARPRPWEGARRTAPAFRWKTDFVRVTVSTVVATLVTALVLLAIIRFTDVDLSETLQMQVTAFVILWPTYTLVYVAWGSWVYSRLDHASLAQVIAADDEGERRLLSRLLGLTGTTNTTISAAVVAVVVTVVIGQRPEFRGEAVYIAAALSMVASSWILMVFSFAQTYLRLGVADDGEHVRFHFPERARFGDYVTLAVLLSTMAATTPAQLNSRRAWRVVRTNVIIAFVFNSVVIAMMVSLLFGGLFS